MLDMRMSETSIATPDRLTWEEVRARYPDQWVVLVDADWVDDHNFAFGTAQVFASRARRHEATKEMGRALRAFANVGCFFTGTIRGSLDRIAAS